MVRQNFFLAKFSPVWYFVTIDIKFNAFIHICGMDNKTIRTNDMHLLIKALI